ncbi:hypothetical protein E2C01_078634 [Portunus trituberculatus]|uniref:Uncharacterized protein n=1 Tax=Portunus trituberculatus TaxID=210409 RepID=A0A5B7IND3_PORTR|nr:hypothetical protein [Portunus trituberculatus]
MKEDKDDLKVSYEKRSECKCWVGWCVKPGPPPSSPRYRTMTSCSFLQELGHNSCSYMQHTGLWTCSSSFKMKQRLILKFQIMMPDMYKSEETGQVSAALRMCRQYSLDSTELMLLSAVILLRSRKLSA